MTEENQQKQLSPTEQDASPSAHRVKLYQLNAETNWEDKGTGFCVYQVVNFIFDNFFMIHEKNASLKLFRY
jgi:hypothetical protein